jgi:class 3 adenylate cyclase/tetratricopeptide (TPR) repeat protein
MKCPRCQHENPPQAKFCLECGARFSHRCSQCGTELPAGAKFCLECGQAVGGPTAGQDRFGSPDSYTPKHLAEKILTSKSALEGERKHVTVLFADLKGSMELLADRDPEEARKILDPVLEHMMEAVHRFEGTVNQVMGDGIMALFGAPLGHEDHAVRACYAALRMQDSVKRYAEGVRRVEGVPIRIRVGLNSGEVVVRSVGSDLRMDYTAVGQTTHLAARMEQLAEPGTTLFAPATLALCEDLVQVKSLGPMRVKGLADPLEAYELTGANPMRSRFHAHAARGLTKFVGRTSEMAQLDDALDLARKGRGQVVAVVGEPGVGKSRLFWEFTHSHRTAGCLVLEAASVSYGKATAYFPVIELLRGYFQIESRDDVRKIREKVTGKLLSLDRALEAALPALLAILDVPVEDEQWTRLDPPQRRQRTLDAVKHLLLRESHVQPLVVVFEDLHWIDGETQNVLEKVIESLPTAAMLMLVNYRPEYQHLWGSKTYYRQLRLDALPTANAAELLEALLGSDPGLASLKRLLIERTEGNPFFLEESVRTLVETKALTGETGAYRLTRAPESLQIPPTAQAILAARIDRLLPEDKRLLQAAAVVGKDVPFALLQAIADDPASSFHGSLARLQAAEFLYETQLFPEVEYTFKHALTHEIAYAGMTNDRRRALDASIVEAIERQAGDRLTEHIERLAHHAFRGEVWSKAAPYLHQAGEKASERCANRQAVAELERALVALAHQPDGQERLKSFVAVKVLLRNGLTVLGELEAALGHARDALKAAEAMNDLHLVGLSSRLVAGSLWLTGRSVEAVPFADRALETAAATGDVSSCITSNVTAAQIHLGLGNYNQTIGYVEQNLNLIQDDHRFRRFGHISLPSAFSRLWLAWCLGELGQFDRALSVAGEALELATSAQHAFSLPGAQWAVEILRVLRGDGTRAIPGLEHGLALCKSTENMVWEIPYSAVLGRALTLAGRAGEAIGPLEEAVANAPQRNRVSEALWTTWLGDAYLAANRIADARRVATVAQNLAHKRRLRGEEAHALRLVAEIGVLQNPSDLKTAEDRYHDAKTLAEERGMRPLIAHCHLGLGKLYRRTGQREQAQEHLTTATTMYREMGMTYWLGKVEAELKL